MMRVRIAGADTPKYFSGRCPRRAGWAA